MKKLFVLVLAVIVLIVLLRGLKESEPAVSRQRPPEAAPAATPGAPVMPPGVPLVPTPRATAAAMPAAAPMGRGPSQALIATATRSGVRIERYEAEGANAAIITVGWPGDVATVGADFLQAALSAGLIRDFDIPALDQGRRMSPDGRSAWWSTYRVHF